MEHELKIKVQTLACTPPTYFPVFAAVDAQQSCWGMTHSQSAVWAQPCLLPAWHNGPGCKGKQKVLLEGPSSSSPGQGMSQRKPWALIRTPAPASAAGMSHMNARKCSHFHTTTSQCLTSIISEPVPCSLIISPHSYQWCKNSSLVFTKTKLNSPGGISFMADKNIAHPPFL